MAAHGVPSQFYIIPLTVLNCMLSPACDAQASTALTAAFTPFTLANFTQSILVNLTNVNGTNQDPVGAFSTAFS